MKLNIITLFPEYFEALNLGVVSRALKDQLISVETINPRQFTEDVHKTVDDRPYGGGDGMVMLAEPLERALQSIEIQGKVVYLSAQGQPWSDRKARQQAASAEPLTIICGRYGGIDQRFINQYVDEEWSLGDFVLSGGELAALAMIDSMARHLPGVLGNKNSAILDSFADGLLEAPLFTRPEHCLGADVPPVLLSGHHAKIEEWRAQVSLLVTYKKRADLIGLLQQEDLRLAIDSALAWPESTLEALGLDLEEIKEWKSYGKV